MKYTKFLFITFFVVSVSFGCAKKDETETTETILQPDVTAPSAPSSLTAQAGNGMINLYWSKSPEGDVAKYRLYRNTSFISGSPKADLARVQKISFKEQGYIEETGAFFADTDVVLESTYYYRVASIDKSNNESGKSGQVVITFGDQTAPAKPAGLTALTGNRRAEINLSWTANSETDLLGYKIYKSDSGGNTYTYLATSTANTYTVTGLTSGVQYYFIITAIDTSGNESVKSSVVVGNPNGDSTAPAKPAGLTAVVGTRKGEVNLSWAANSESDLLSYRIYKSDSGSNFSFLISQSETTYTVTGLIPGNSYFFTVSALDNSSNEGEYSEIVFCKAKGDSVAPAMPTGLTVLAGAGGSGIVNLSWTANTEPDLAKYNIYQSAAGISYSKIDEKIAPETTYIFYGFTSTYCYFRIKAVDDSGNESDYSGQVGVVVP